LGVLRFKFHSTGKK